MKPEKKARKERDPSLVGAFMPDGSYFADALLSQRGPADRFVRTMVKSRGTYGFDPKTAAEAILLTKMEGAFPNHGQWHELAVDNGSAAWPFVRTSTSAEEAVKRCGLGMRGPNGEARHWCGELWREGDEKHCDYPGHRAGAKDETRDRLDRILASLPAGLRPARFTPSGSAPEPVTPPKKQPKHPGTTANEDWFRNHAR